MLNLLQLRLLKPEKYWYLRVQNGQVHWQAAVKVSELARRKHI
jgi:hypothetical protein